MKQIKRSGQILVHVLIVYCVLFEQLQLIFLKNFHAKPALSECETC